MESGMWVTQDEQRKSYNCWGCSYVHRQHTHTHNKIVSCSLHLPKAIKALRIFLVYGSQKKQSHRKHRKITLFRNNKHPNEEFNGPIRQRHLFKWDRLFCLEWFSKWFCGRVFLDNTARVQLILPSSNIVAILQQHCVFLTHLRGGIHVD